MIELFLDFLGHLVLSLVFEKLSDPSQLLLGGRPPEIINGIEELRLFVLDSILRLELKFHLDFL